MTTTAATVNAIIYANPADAPTPAIWEPTHPALAALAWEDERTDVHAVIGGQLGLARYAFSCACGYETPECTSLLDASAAIISHALHTCAVCHGPNPATDMHGQMDVFPRCSGCAF